MSLVRTQWHRLAAAEGLRFEYPRNDMVVAYKDHERVGEIVVGKLDDIDWFVSRIFVEPRLRREGIAEALLVAAHDYFFGRWAMTGFSSAAGARWGRAMARKYDWAYWDPDEYDLQQFPWTKTAASGVLYHLADKVNFVLDPKFRPEINTTIGGQMPPGVFLADSVEHWVNGYGYWRPWVVEIRVPSNVEGGWTEGRETFVPATNFGRIQIVRVVPLDAHCREEFGAWGWTEDYFETTFDTEEPISPEDLRNYSRWRGYHYPGDARRETSTWHQYYAKRVKKYQRSHPGGALV